MGHIESSQREEESGLLIEARQKLSLAWEDYASNIETCVQPDEVYSDELRQEEEAIPTNAITEIVTLKHKAMCMTLPLLDKEKASGIEVTHTIYGVLKREVTFKLDDKAENENSLCLPSDAITEVDQEKLLSSLAFARAKFKTIVNFLDDHNDTHSKATFRNLLRVDFINYIRIIEALKDEAIKRITDPKTSNEPVSIAELYHSAMKAGIALSASAMLMMMLVGCAPRVALGYYETPTPRPTITQVAHESVTPPAATETENPLPPGASSTPAPIQETPTPEPVIPDITPVAPEPTQTESQPTEVISSTVPTATATTEATPTTAPTNTPEATPTEIAREYTLGLESIEACRQNVISPEHLEEDLTRITDLIKTDLRLHPDLYPTPRPIGYGGIVTPDTELPFSQMGMFWIMYEQPTDGKILVPFCGKIDMPNGEIIVFSLPYHDEYGELRVAHFGMSEAAVTEIMNSGGYAFDWNLTLANLRGEDPENNRRIRLSIMTGDMYQTDNKNYDELHELYGLAGPDYKDVIERLLSTQNPGIDYSQLETIIMPILNIFGE